MNNTYPHSNPFNLYLFYIELKAILSFYNAFCKEKKLFDPDVAEREGTKKKKAITMQYLLCTSQKNKFNNIM